MAVTMKSRLRQWRVAAAVCRQQKPQTLMETDTDGELHARLDSGRVTVAAEAASARRCIDSKY
eukprot:4249806-Pleurochrysis_carterae.AAC.1